MIYLHKMYEVKFTNLLYVKCYWTFVYWILKPIIGIADFTNSLGHID